MEHVWSVISYELAANVLPFAQIFFVFHLCKFVLIRGYSL
jgi:hypothetical protein